MVIGQVGNPELSHPGSINEVHKTKDQSPDYKFLGVSLLTVDYESFFSFKLKNKALNA